MGDLKIRLRFDIDDSEVRQSGHDMKQWDTAAMRLLRTKPLKRNDDIRRPAHVISREALQRCLNADRAAPR